MIKPLLVALAGIAVAGVAKAQAPAQPPAPARARGPAAALAVEAAQTAVASCLASGYKVTAEVVDSAGVPVVMLSADGAGARSQAVVMTKIWATLTYRQPSSQVADRAKTDPALDAAIKANPKIGQARQGALPIMVGNDMIGAIGVAGAAPGKDEPCTKAGLARIAARLN